MLAVHVEPGQPMGEVVAPIDHDDAIALRGAVAGLAARGGDAAPRAPMKTPRLGGVVEQGAQPFGGHAFLATASRWSGALSLPATTRGVRRGCVLRQQADEDP